MFPLYGSGLVSCNKLVLWPNLYKQQSITATHSHPTPPPTGWMGRESEGWTLENLWAEKKGSLMGKNKKNGGAGEETSDAKHNCLQPATLWATEAFQACSPSSFAGHSFVWYGMVSWGQLYWLCPLPVPCATPAFLTGSLRNRKKSCFCVSAAWQQLKHCCITLHYFISIIFITNLKHSTA